MSDATRASEASGRGQASPDPASAEQPISGKKRWAYRMWNVGRVLGTVASLLLSYAVWAPWVVIRGYTPSPLNGQFVPGQSVLFVLALGPGDIDFFIDQTAWGILTVSGVMLSLLLWHRAWRDMTRLALQAYGFWCGPLVLALELMPVRVKPEGNDVHLLPGTGPNHLVANPTQWLPAFYLFNIALVVFFGAAVMLIAAHFGLRHEARVADLLRSGPVHQSREAIVLLAGILLWALGALVLPWRAGGCAQIPFVAQSCAPGGFGDMLQRGLSGDPALLNPRIGMYALPALLIYLALLALAGLWRRVPLRLLATWTSLWLAGSTVALAFAVRGVIMTQPVAFGPGLVVAFAGLFLAACGLAWLYAQASASPDLPDQLALG